MATDLSSFLKDIDGRPQTTEKIRSRKPIVNCGVLADAVGKYY